ncbi:RNA polymerase sigma factor [Hyphobacterium sp.]|uniref:RNA polymerase sigma factor n=1 Tax=Hyphobacterium sp. TaxID=2004662 RepID=UPI003B5175F8
MTRQQTSRILDEYLILTAMAGSRMASGKLAQRWYPRYLRTAQRILRDHDLAEEAVQETWEAISKGWMTLSDPARFPSWSFGILSRKCADILRRRVRERSRATDQNAEDTECAAGDAERRADIHAAFQSLGPEHRIVATLFFGEQLSLAEIAAATRVPVGTVKSRLFHARRQLRAALTGSEVHE